MKGWKLRLVVGLGRLLARGVAAVGDRIGELVSIGVTELAEGCVDGDEQIVLIHVVEV